MNWIFFKESRWYDFSLSQGLHDHYCGGLRESFLKSHERKLLTDTVALGISFGIFWML